MKVTELRIGNLVFIEYPVGLIIRKINRYHIGQIYDGLENAKPIPLSEDWLIKLGFEVNPECASIGENPITKDYLIYLMNTGSGWFYRNAHHKLKYVHQLQNLYFALTGKELEA